MKKQVVTGFVITCAFLSILLTAVNISGEPYKRMLDDPLTFTGVSENKPVLSGSDPVSIGLFVPDHADHPAGQAIIKGATLALSMANQTGGYRNRPFKSVIRWAGTPWSAGPQEMIRFAYQDNVVAVISYLSAASHIAGQIALKTYLPVITPVASDTTLTHARVPWIFRLPPDDHQQAEILVKACRLGSGSGKAGLITATDQDSRMAARELEKEMIVQQTPPLFHHEISETLSDFKSVTDVIKKASPGGLILRLKHTQMADAIKSIRASGIECPIFIPWIPGFESAVIPSGELSGITLVEPFLMGSDSQICGVFLKAYREMYHEWPLPSAAYGFDAMQLLIKAVQNRGTDRVAIRKELVNLSGFVGATGCIEWDTGGGNTSRPSIRIFQ